MATADEFATAAWQFKLTDPHDGTPQAAGTLLGWARNDAYRGLVQTVSNSNALGVLESELAALTAKVDALSLSGIDVAALVALLGPAITELVQSVINDTVLTVRPPS